MRPDLIVLFLCSARCYHRLLELLTVWILRKVAKQRFVILALTIVAYFHVNLVGCIGLEFAKVLIELFLISAFTNIMGIAILT